MKVFYILLFHMVLMTTVFGQANRTYDGTNNNLINPEWGSTGSHFMNFLESGYSDGIAQPAGQNRPNPRLISNKIFGQNSFIASNMFLTDFAWSFGQFIDHDITFNDDNHEEFIPISVPMCDANFDPECSGEVIIPMKRSKSDEASGTSIDNPRKHINDITHWIDGSGVYGNTKEKADWLRTFQGGKLKTSEGGFLPFNTIDGQLTSPVDPDAPFMLLEGEIPIRHFIAGDLRANEQPSLCSLHTLFVREHNRLCDEIIVEHPQWDDEKIHQHARKIVGGLIQNILFHEWLPSLGIHIEEYQGYQPDVDPSIFNVFSAAAFRLGHTLVNDQIIRLDENENEISYGSIVLKDAFFKPLILVDEGGLSPIFRGMASQMQQTFDTKIVDVLRNFLFGPAGAGGLDLVSLNIHRGRERGLLDYNSIRASFGLEMKNDFSEITSNPLLAAKLEDVYEGNINNIDPWVGMLSEDMGDHVAVGELVMTIIKRQFENLRDADRYYFEVDYALSQEEIQKIKDTKMSDLIKRNTNVVTIQKNVFLAEGHDFTGIQMDGFENIRAVEIKAFPNPVIEHFTLDIYTLLAEKGTFQLTDLNGKVVLQEEIVLNAGNNHIKIELGESYTSGVYIINLTTNDGKGSLKIIKN